MRYEKKCLRCGVVSEAARWPGQTMAKTLRAAICKERTTHHFKEKDALPATRSALKEKYFFKGPRGPNVGFACR